MISQSRWEWVIKEVASSLEYFGYGNELTDEEFKLVISTLKNNTPFQVLPDCCLSNNKQQVGKPNKETIEAMNDGVILETNIVVLETNNVLLETQHFKVLGDKE